MVLFVLVLGTLSGCRSVSYFKAGNLVSQADMSEIPFSRLKELIVLEAKINGIKGRFILDNGFSMSAVNAGFAERAGMIFTSYSSATDANNKRTRLERAQTPSIQIGDQVFKDTWVYKIDTKLFLPCDSLDGIIGASIINKVNWKIDFTKQLLWLSPKPFPSRGLKVPISIAPNNTSTMILNVHGADIPLKVDLGKSGDFEFKSDDFKDHFAGSSAIMYSGISSLSATGPGDPDVNYIMVDSVEIKDLKGSSMMSGKIEISENMNKSAYVGIKYFDDYTLTINSQERHYILERATNTVSTASNHSYGIGIYLIDGLWKMIRKNNLHPELEKIPLMSEVESINGKSMDQYGGLCSFLEFIEACRSEQVPLTVVFSNFEHPVQLEYTMQRTIKLN